MNNAKFFATSAHLPLAEEIAQILGISLGKRTLKKFSCGEIYINYDETVRGQDVFLVTTIRPQYVHEDFFELFLMCDAARRSFAKSVHVIVPHFGYSRQDKIHSARESISMKLCADLLTQSGADHVITLNLHADQSQAFFNVPVDNLSPRRMFVEYFQKKNIPDAVVVSPDAGGAKMAKKFADALGVDLAILHKNRPGHNTSEVSHLIGDVSGKTPILYDDMIDTAGSVCNAKKALEKNGCNPEVYLCATHPIFSGPAIDRLTNAEFTEIVVTNSIPVRQQAFPSLRQLSIAPLISLVVENVINEKSVSELYF
jgi:ribose-phosphate pyrophosphokinase